MSRWISQASISCLQGLGGMGFQRGHEGSHDFKMLSVVFLSLCPGEGFKCRVQFLQTNGIACFPGFRLDEARQMLWRSTTALRSMAAPAASGTGSINVIHV